LERKKEIELLEEEEANLAHQIELHKVESQERLLKKDRERSSSMVEKMSSNSAARRNEMGGMESAKELETLRSEVQKQMARNEVL
jgi:hypothetical protein